MRKKEQVKKKDVKNRENGMERRRKWKEEEKKEWKFFSTKSLPFDPFWIRNNFANLDRQMERSDKS